MWLTATTQPPVAGIFWPSIQSRRVSVRSGGLTTATANVQAQPRLSWSLRTFGTDFPSPRVNRSPVEGETTARDGRSVRPADAGEVPVRREVPPGARSRGEPEPDGRPHAGRGRRGWPVPARGGRPPGQ